MKDNTGIKISDTPPFLKQPRPITPILPNPPFLRGKSDPPFFQCSLYKIGGGFNYGSKNSVLN